MLDLVRSLPIQITRVRLGGGGNKSALWRQMQADVYGLPVATVNNDEGPAFGAALLAGVGIGVWKQVAEACGATIREQDVHEPARRAVADYSRIRTVFDPLYTQFSPAMHALTSLSV
jgi:xylulokinase